MSLLGTGEEATCGSSQSLKEGGSGLLAWNSPKLCPTPARSEMPCSPLWGVKIKLLYLIYGKLVSLGSPDHSNFLEQWKSGRHVADSWPRQTVPQLLKRSTAHFRLRVLKAGLQI